jgi:hypothetical protein
MFSLIPRARGRACGRNLSQYGPVNRSRAAAAPTRPRYLLKQLHDCAATGFVPSALHRPKRPQVTCHVSPTTGEPSAAYAAVVKAPCIRQRRGHRLAHAIKVAQLWRRWRRWLCPLCKMQPRSDATRECERRQSKGWGRGGEGGGGTVQAVRVARSRPCCVVDGQHGIWLQCSSRKASALTQQAAHKNRGTCEGEDWNKMQVRERERGCECKILFPSLPPSHSSTQEIPHQGSCTCLYRTPRLRGA